MMKCHLPTLLSVGSVSVPLKLDPSSVRELASLLCARSGAELALRLSNPRAAQILPILSILARSAGGEKNAALVQKVPLHLGEALRSLSTVLSGTDWSIHEKSIQSVYKERISNE